MHELSIAISIVDTVIKQAEAASADLVSEVEQGWEEILEIESAKLRDALRGLRLWRWLALSAALLGGVIGGQLMRWAL